MPDFRGNYAYNDTGDLDDLEKKLWYLNKYGLKIGISIGIWDRWFYHMTTKPADVVLAIGKHSFRFCSVFTSFAVGVYISASLREKDDGFNHMVGLVSAGAIASALIANPVPLGLSIFPGCSLISFCKEYRMETGHSAFEHKRDHLTAHSADWHISDFKWEKYKRNERLHERYDKYNDEWRRQQAEKLNEDNPEGTMV